MIIKIKRQDSSESTPYWQSFRYEEKTRKTVAGILDDLNNRNSLTDEQGNACRRIRWECSCLQKMCGACAMIINHRPALACSTFIEPDTTAELILEPLSKFPVVIDLCVDRSCIFEALKQANAYLGTLSETDLKEFPYQYNVAKCLKCGLCLEVCPNYTGGGKFHGAVWANEAYLLSSSTEDRKKEIRKNYQKHFEAGCSKSLSCQEVCPMKISTLSSMGYMNRLFEK